MRKPGLEPGSQPWQGQIITTKLLALVIHIKNLALKSFLLQIISFINEESNLILNGRMERKVSGKIWGYYRY